VAKKKQFAPTIQPGGSIMKKIMTTLAVALSITAFTGISNAQNMEGQQMMMSKMMSKGMMNRGMHNADGGKHGMMNNQEMMPMMMNGCRMNPMMMSGQGMRSMMKPMMKGMMGGGMSPMMGYNPEQNNNYQQNYQKFQKFFQETKTARKQLNDMQFDYGEALWNKDTTLGELQEMRTKMNNLRQEIYKKRPKNK